MITIELQTPDLRILSLLAGRFDALILSHLAHHIHAHSLLPALTSFGLREEAMRNPPGAPAHDPMVALLPFFDGRAGLKFIQIETAHGVHTDRLEMMIDMWRDAGCRLRGLRLSVEGGAEESRTVMDLLRGDGHEGDDALLEDVRELVVRVPDWNGSAVLPTALTYIVS